MCLCVCVLLLLSIYPFFAGGYAFVYVAQDVKTGTEYALKRLIGADQQACQAINNEINVHRQLSGNGNIVTFIGSSAIAPSGQQGAQFLLLTELCKGECNALYDLYTLYKLSFIFISSL